MRDGTSHTCEVKGMDVSIVMVVLSSAAADEIERRRDRAEVRGLRRLDPDAEDKRERAISEPFGSFRGYGIQTEIAEMGVRKSEGFGEEENRVSQNVKILNGLLWLAAVRVALSTFF